MNGSPYRPVDRQTCKVLGARQRVLAASVSLSSSALLLMVSFDSMVYSYGLCRVVGVTTVLVGVLT